MSGRFFLLFGKRPLLSGVEFDHQRHVADDRNFVALRQGHQRAGQVFLGNGKVGGSRLTTFHRVLDDLKLFSFLTDADHIARLHAIGRNVDFLAIHFDMRMGDELAGGVDGRREAGSENDRIQTSLQKLDHGLTGVGGLGGRLAVVVYHLSFVHVVLATEALLFNQLALVFRQFGTPGVSAVLSRGIGTAFHDLRRLRSDGDAKAAGETNLRSFVIHVMIPK